jgi:hypothetical protein
MKKLILCLIFSGLCVNLRSENYDDIPLSVRQQIVADYEKRYPNDFCMQEFMIKEQIKNYKETVKLKKDLLK